MDSAGQQLTLAWLACTFELFDGASLARREVYREYVEFCQRFNLNATTAAIFGKLVRMVFPTISSRRLGRRGANVVHYYNFRQKATPSPLLPSLSPAPAGPVSAPPSTSTTAAADTTTHKDAERIAPTQPPPSSARAGGGGASIASLLSPMSPQPADSPSSSLPAPFPPVPETFSDETAMAFPSYTAEQSMNDPYTLASAAQARVNAPPVDPSLLYVKPCPPLWPSGEGAHLFVMRLAGHFMQHYRHSYYILCPVHPAALEENNVRYILCTKEGSEERSALSLNVYFALCQGAMISGHITHARYFFQTTKEHLSDVFDMTDYSVAQALVPMGFQERFFARDEAEGWRVAVYYLTLANQICRRLGALASDVYSRCSKAVFFMEDVDIDTHPESRDASPGSKSKQDKSWEEIIQSELNFHEQIQQQKQSWLSYSAARRTHKILYAILFAIVHLMDAMNNLEKLRQTALAGRKRSASVLRGGGYEGAEEGEDEEEEEEEEEREYTKTCGGGRALARLLGLIVPRETGQSDGHQATPVEQGDEEMPSAPFRIKTVREKGLGRKDVARIAKYFTDQLLLLEEELLVLYQGTEIGERYLSPQLYNMTKIFIYGLRAENKWTAGDRDSALALITDFVELHRRDKFNLMLFENKPTFQRVLDILRELGHWDTMRQLLAQLEPLAKVSPIFSAMCDHFASVIETN